MDVEQHEEEEARMEQVLGSKNKACGYSCARRIEPLSPFRSFSTHSGNVTPVAARNQNLNWVNNITQICEK
jgi:hypothetical protein